ncbi:MAG: FkbM family methyltransferase [Balneolales bacterium]
MINIIRYLLGKPRKKSLQKIINRFSRSKENIFFIQIGSNDGVTRDPLNRHIRDGHWRGIVVEPVRYIYEKLVSNYKDFPGIMCENLAIADENTTKKFYRLKQTNDGLPEWYDQLGSFYSDIVQAHRHKINNFDKYYTTDLVSCVTLDTLLEKHTIKNIDLLHVDAEGYDYEIIKMINFNKFKPEIILFEHKHLSIADYKKAMALMKRHNYRLYTEKNDTLALLRR